MKCWLLSLSVKKRETTGTKGIPDRTKTEADSRKCHSKRIMINKQDTKIIANALTMSIVA